LKNWRQYVIAGAVVFTSVAILGVSQYLKALPDAPAGSATTGIVPVPNELAVDERQDAYIGGQTYMAIMNSELTDTYTGVGWRGSGRSMSPTMGYPSFTFPAGGLDAPLWASAFGITAYQPNAVAGMPISRAEGSFIGTTNVYRAPPHQREQAPQGFWSDQGGSSSPGFAGGTTGPGGYREPFITETTFNTNAGIRVLRQSYSFSYGYGHTNDFILLRHVLNVHGDVDVNQDGALEEQGVPIKNFFAIFNYDFDIPWTNNPLLTGGATGGGTGGDDKTPPGMFRREMPLAVPEGLINSGRFDQAPYGPRFYSGLSTMFDEDNPGHPGIDSYVWNTTNGNFNPLHVGEASLMILEGSGDGANGDLDAKAALDIYEAPSVGLFNLHEWWISDLRTVFGWYEGSATKYLENKTINVPGGSSAPNPNLFISGSSLERTTDISTWVAKTQTGQSGEGLGVKWGDPRNLTQAGNPGLAAGIGLKKGMYDSVTLFDLDGVFAGIVPDPYEGSDTKEETSGAGCIRNALGWGPYTKAPGEDLTIWHVDIIGAGKDGAYDVYLRAQDVWMQRKYNVANNTYYWDGSNDRTIPVYNPDGSYELNDDGSVVTETLNFGRGADSGALFHPPPPPTLSVFPTNNGTIAVAWANNAETAIDPGKGSVDFAKYRLYRASGFIDQFPTSTVAHEVGYNSTIIPPNLGLSDGASAITDVTDPTAASVKQSHPYGRFIHEGLTLGADYNIGRVYDFVADDLVKRFAAPNFSGPYVQIAEFGGGGGNQTNTLVVPESVTYPNPYDAASRLPGFTGENITTKPSSAQVIETNNGLGATTAIALSFSDRYGSTIGSGDAQITSIGDIATDSRLVGQSGYIFEDRSVLIGFSYWYYVAAVDNESAVQYDFDNYVQDQNSSQQQIARTINGLESFYTMNANGTDGRWHGQYPYRGLTVGPEVPGQDVIPTTVSRNTASAGTAEFENLITVAPNPFVFQAQWDLATKSQSVKFFNMPVPARVTIFDSAGLQVKQFGVPGDKTTTVGGVTNWNLKNDSNVPVASGLYICVIEAEIGGESYAKTLKLYVRR